MLERTRARRQALQILYAREMTPQSVGDILGEHTYMTEDGEPLEYARALSLGVEAQLPRIDEVLSSVSENWIVSRMPVVDRCVLRLACYEILFMLDVPASVCINEAVEMAKIFGGQDSPKFVNGVLGRIAGQFREEEHREAGDE